MCVCVYVLQFYSLPILADSSGCCTHISGFFLLFCLMCNIIGFVIILGGLEGCAICLCIAFGYGELDRMMRLMRVTKRKNGDAGAVILAKLLKFMETNEIRSKRKSTWLLLFLLVGDTCACILSSCTWSFKHSLRCHLTELADPNHSVFYACRF